MPKLVLNWDQFVAPLSSTKFDPSLTYGSTQKDDCGSKDAKVPDIGVTGTKNAQGQDSHDWTKCEFIFRNSMNEEEWK